jgi:Domain of unknown function (DUF4404)
MENRRLKETLEQLHVELSQTDRIDPEALSLLRALTDDINRVLEKRGGGQPVDDDEADPVTSGLKDLLLKFEAEHPEFSAAVGKVADALAAIGI